MLGRQGKPNTREPRTREGDPKAVYESAAKKIQTAIAAGEITQAQGKARLEKGSALYLKCLIQRDLLFLPFFWRLLIKVPSLGYGSNVPHRREQHSLSDGLSEPDCDRRPEWRMKKAPKRRLTRQGFVRGCRFQCSPFSNDIRDIAESLKTSSRCWELDILPPQSPLRRPKPSEYPERIQPGIEAL